MSSDDTIKETESQIIFISLFAKPLLEPTVRASPNLSKYCHHCKANLQSLHQWKAIFYNQYACHCHRRHLLLLRLPSTTINWLSISLCIFPRISKLPIGVGQFFTSNNYLSFISLWLSTFFISKLLHQACSPPSPIFPVLTSSQPLRLRVLKSFRVVMQLRQGCEQVG